MTKYYALIYVLNFKYLDHIVHNFLLIINTKKNIISRTFSNCSFVLSAKFLFKIFVFQNFGFEIVHFFLACVTRNCQPWLKL